MNILRVISSMNPQQGGPCQGIRNAIPELLKLGVSNEVVSLDPPNAAYLGKDSFTIHALGAAKTPWGYNSQLIPWLRDNFNRFDVIIIHGLWLYHSHAAIKAITQYKKTHTTAPKIYIMPHGMLDPYFQKARERRLKAIRNTIYWNIFEKRVINTADGVLFTCEEELLLARTTFSNYYPKKEINIGYGIQPPPSFTSQMKDSFMDKVPQWNQQPFLLFLSRIHPKKGVDILIKAYLQLEKELENLPQLVIAGPGLEEAYGKEMMALAAKSNNILFPGMLQGEAKWGAFYESEVFVLPSHQENFGIAVVEALACGKPVLISNKVNIWREINKGNAGIVKDDTKSETQMLLNDWLIKNNEEKTQMSKDAQKVYLKHFTIEQAGNQLYNSIC